MYTDGNLLKLMILVDEGWVYKFFDGRKNNTYAKSVYEKIMDNVANRGKDFSNLDRSEIQKMFTDFMAKAKLGAFDGGLLPLEKYLGVHAKHNAGPGGRVEFRYVGGNDYHKKSKEVKLALARFAYFMSESLKKTGPNEKLYITKLYKMFDDLIVSKGKTKTTTKDIRVVKDITKRLGILQRTELDDLLRAVNFFVRVSDQKKVIYKSIFRDKRIDLDEFLLRFYQYPDIKSSENLTPQIKKEILDRGLKLFSMTTTKNLYYVWKKYDLDGFRHMENILKSMKEN